MTIKELSALVDLCLEKRIKQMKFENTDLYFDDSAFISTIMPSANAKPANDDRSLDMPSDDDMLNWSSPIQTVEEPKSN